MTGFTDIHTHFVFGVDDGARTQSDMTAMLDAANEDGVVSLYATSHRTPGIAAFDDALYAANLEAARDYCRMMGYPIVLHAGAELLYTPTIERYAKEHRLTTLGESNTILLEFLPRASYDEIERAVELMDRCGYRTILAHIERYEGMKRQNAYRLKERHDVYYQVNCSTVITGHSFFENRRVSKWLRDELIDYVASDAHSCAHRPTRMREAYETLADRVGTDYADWLMKGKALPASKHV